uniref:Uncharacterized protein n=1 Tax=Sphaerodactylus townsendi TaxID=933632 RepID=A0ACB8FG15_9SAUR
MLQCRFRQKKAQYVVVVFKALLPSIKIQPSARSTLRMQLKREQGPRTECNTIICPSALYQHLRRPDPGTPGIFKTRLEFLAVVVAPLHQTCPTCSLSTRPYERALEQRNPISTGRSLDYIYFKFKNGNTSRQKRTGRKSDALSLLRVQAQTAVG